MILGHTMRHALAFAQQYPGWHTFAKDRATSAAIVSLAALGLVVINVHRQFRLRSPDCGRAPFN